MEVQKYTSRPNFDILDKNLKIFLEHFLIKIKQGNGGHFNNRDELTNLYIEIGTDQKMSFLHVTKFY